jgi:hypothetical protein
MPSVTHLDDLPDPTRCSECTIIKARLPRPAELDVRQIRAIQKQRGTGTMLHWILPRLAAYIAVVVAVGLLFLAGASVYALMWPKPVVPFGQMGH